MKRILLILGIIFTSLSINSQNHQIQVGWIEDYEVEQKMYRFIDICISRDPDEDRNLEFTYGEFKLMGLYELSYEDWHNRGEFMQYGLLSVTATDLAYNESGYASWSYGEAGTNEFINGIQIKFIIDLEENSQIENNLWVLRNNWKYKGESISHTDFWVFDPKTIKPGEIFTGVLTEEEYQSLLEGDGGVQYTRINNLVESSVDTDKIYDLSGREINLPEKGGIYIKNGKKYIMK